MNELATFNPEMLDKQRVLAITKSDLLDEELIQMLSENLPTCLMCLSLRSRGWHSRVERRVVARAANSESNKLQAITDRVGLCIRTRT